MTSGGERILGWVFDTTLRRYARRDAAAAERAGERFGLLAYRLDKKHRTRAEKNLRLAFPERPESWAVETARESFLHFGRLAGDLMRAPARSDAEVLANMGVPEKLDAFFDHAKDRGIIFCTGHMGNWERAAHWVTARGHKLSVVMRPVDQPVVQARVEALRRAAGIELLSRGDAAMGMLRRLRRGECIAVLPDQNADDAFVPFFGHPTGTVLGPAVMAKRANALIVPAFCLRTGPGRYRFAVQDPLDGATTSLDPTEIMARYYQALESACREAPEQYLWMHDRWKSARRKRLL